MNQAPGTSIKPRKKRIKRIIAGLSLFSLGRGFQAAAALDPDIKMEVESWPDDYTVIMKVMPYGPNMVLAKKEGGVKYLGGKDRQADLTVMFKNLESALRVLTARMGTPEAYAQHRIMVKGDLGNAMTLTRCLNITQAYLFPKLIGRRIMKRVPRIPLFRLLKNRFIIYVTGVPFGRP